jgi:ubiquinone/menaquinone biosynthesis C-methylase UbiE
MDHADHVQLIRAGIIKTGGVWADFGSGRGAFTLALAEILGSDAQIYSVDKNQTALHQQQRAMKAQFPDARVQYLHADYTQPLDLPPLDGIVMANALHFQRAKGRILAQIHGYLKSSGRLILVEYNLDQGNTWVPYPISYQTWENMACRSGFAQTQLLSKRPSRFMGEMYAALSWNQPIAKEL